MCSREVRPHSDESCAPQNGLLGRAASLRHKRPLLRWPQEPSAATKCANRSACRAGDGFRTASKAAGGKPAVHSDTERPMEGVRIDALGQKAFSFLVITADVAMAQT